MCVYTQVQCNPSGPATHSKPSLLSTTQVPTGPPAIQTGHLHCQMLALMGLGCSKDDLERRAGWRWLGATKIIVIPDPAQALPPNDPGDPLLRAFLAPGRFHSPRRVSWCSATPRSRILVRPVPLSPSIHAVSLDGLGGGSLSTGDTSGNKAEILTLMTLPMLRCREHSVKADSTLQCERNSQDTMDNQQGPTVEHMEFCSMLYVNLDERGVFGENGYMY